MREARRVAGVVVMGVRVHSQGRTRSPRSTKMSNPHAASTLTRLLLLASATFFFFFALVRPLGCFNGAKREPNHPTSTPAARQSLPHSTSSSPIFKLATPCSSFTATLGGGPKLGRGTG